MNRRLLILSLALILALLGYSPKGSVAKGPQGDRVVLVHGLAGGPWTMWLLGERLRDQGYEVTAVDYPSRQVPIAEQVTYFQRELERCCLDGPGHLHFVTHSMGGILVRALIARHRPPNLGRVVMLSPPNKGTPLADALAGNWFFEFVLGPAVDELGTSPRSVPNQLPPPDFELGVLAATRAWNMIGSLIIPGPDDGTVPIDSMKIDGMADFRAVSATHTFIMNDPEVALETAYFLEHGRFRPETAQQDPPLLSNPRSSQDPQQTSNDPQGRAPAGLVPYLGLEADHA